MMIASTWGEFMEGAKGSFGLDRAHPLEVLLAIALSFTLNLLIGAVYRNTYRGTRYSQDYVHTLVMIGTITTILIMVVAGNVGIAFGMFAAFSLIRFRRNLGQSRDLAFVFFAMATGMVVGAREYSMALVTTTVVSVAVFILARTDVFASNRSSHQLRVRVTNDIDWDEALTPIFDEFLNGYDVISIETVQAGTMTELRYTIQLKSDKNTADFMERMQIASGNNRIIITSTQRDLDS